MNHNDRVLQGLAWLAATLPTLVQQDCLKGDEITAVSAGGYDVTIQIDDYATAERVAARLGMDEKVGFDVSGKQTWWIEPDGVFKVVTLAAKPSNLPRDRAASRRLQDTAASQAVTA